MITSAANPKVKLVRALQARRSVRQAERAFVVEGVRLLEEAAAAGGPARLALHAGPVDPRAQAALERLAGLGAQVLAVSPGVMAAASSAETPPGVLAVVAQPDLAPPPALAFAVVLDALGDPGNLGAILRTAAAAGADAVFLAPGTVDPYNPKVVRAAMGAHFRLPVVEAGWEAMPGRLAGCACWLAEAGGGVPHFEADFRRPCALLVGAEAAGPSAAARALATARVSIPMPGGAESLNAGVAAGILMYEVVRQRLVWKSEVRGQTGLRLPTSYFRPPTSNRL